MDEATCLSYVVPEIFASPLIVHINNGFLIAIIIIVYFLYSFSFKLPVAVINAHGCLIARLLLLFFPSLPHYLCLEISLINMHVLHMHIHILGCRVNPTQGHPLVQKLTALEVLSACS